MPHASLQDVEHHFEIDVDVRAGDAAGRDRGDVHGQFPGRNVLGREPDLVLNAVPVATGGALANDRDAVVAFHKALQIIDHSQSSAAKILLLELEPIPDAWRS